MHELSKLLWGSYGASIPKGDKIITKYLEEKARIINEPIKESFRDWDERLEWLRGILGLSESQVKEDSIDKCIKKTQENIADALWKDSKLEKWCEHINLLKHEVYTDFRYFDNKWQFCPECGTPRPKAMTLTEKFTDWFVQEKSNDRFCTIASEALAKIAEKHFQSKKTEK